MRTFELKKKYIEICSLGSNWQHVSIGLGDGMANRQQAITRTNIYQDPRLHMALLGIYGLIH